jgi:integrase
MPRSNPRIHRLPDRRDGSPRWQARWWGTDGKQAKRTFGSFTAARDHLLDVDRAKRSGTYVSPQQGRRKLAAYFEAWVAQAGLEETTAALYEGMFQRHIGPSLGHFSLAAITRERVKEWIAELGAKGVGARSIGVAHGVLRRTLAEAVRDGILMTNAAVGVSVPRAEHRQMQPLSAGEVAALASSVPKRDRALVLTLAYTGCRVGEASALRVRHVDLLHSRLHIQGSASEVRGRRIEGSTKTDRERQVALPVFLRDELARHLAAFCSPADPQAYLFTTAEGHPLRVSNWRARVFVPAQRAVGIIPVRRVHDLRHTAAALAIAAGAHPKMLQDMLGHSSITVTLNVYGHLFPSLHDALAASLDEAFRAARTPDRAAVVEIGSGARLS